MAGGQYGGSSKPQSGMGGTTSPAQPWGRPAGASDGGIIGGTPYSPKQGWSGHSFGPFGMLNPMMLPGWRGQGLGSSWQRPGGPQMAGGAGFPGNGAMGLNSAGAAPMAPGAAYNGGQPLDPSTGLPQPTEKPNTGVPGNSAGMPLNANSLAGPAAGPLPNDPVGALWLALNSGNYGP